MVEQRANLDYGADDTSVVDDLTHEPAIDADPIPLEASYAPVTEELVVEEVLVDEDDEAVVTPEASTYGAP